MSAALGVGAAVPGGVSLLCSMATRGLLAEAAATVGGVRVEAAGGVDVARRVRAGERVDVVVLADAAMRALEAEGHLVAGSLRPVAVSSMAVAVREGAAVPDLSDEDAVRRAILDAPRTGYSTGPSGEHLLRLLDRWGLRGVLGERLVRAPPGVPVGRLLAEGAVDLGVQQRSEFLGLAGIVVAGPLPPAIASDTVFTAGIARTAAAGEAGAGFVAALLAPGMAEARRRHGLGAAGR